MELRTLVIRKDESFYSLLHEFLNQYKEPTQLKWVSDENEASEALEEQDFDIYILDIDFGSGKIDHFLKSALSDVPIFKPTIVLLNNWDEEDLLDVVKSGTSEVLLKEGLKPQPLYNAIKYSRQRFIALKERFNSHQLYQNLFFNAPNPHCIVDCEFNFIRSNQKFIQLFRFDVPSEELRDNLQYLFTRTAEFDELKTILSKNEHVNNLEVTLSSGQEEFVCIIDGNTLFNPDGSVSSYHLVVVDQTTRQEKQLADKYSMTGRIARMIAHEVRNPLTNIRLALSQIEAQSTEQSLGLYTEIIKRNSVRINDLISSLLNASLPTELVTRQASIEELVKEAVQEVKDRALLKKIEINVSVEEGLSEQSIDETRLKIAVTNILVNATEAIEHDNGKIDIAVDKPNSEKIRIQIADNGGGMTDEVRKNLFEPFFTNKKTGTGLGLSTTHNIIKAHGGKLKCSSRLGEGTTFTILV